MTLVALAPYRPVGPHGSVPLGAGVYTLGIPPGAKGVLVQAQTQDIYYTIDGQTNPDSASSPPVGNLLYDSHESLLIPLFAGQEVRLLRAADGAVLQYQFVEWR